MNLTQLKTYVSRAVDVVTMNPPYYSGETHTGSGDSKRLLARTHQNTEEMLRGWFKVAYAFLKKKGKVCLIFPTDALTTVLKCAQEKNFGSPHLFPLWPKAGVPSKRFIVHFLKNGKGPVTMLPGLILHHEDGSPTQEATQILREGQKMTVG